MKDVGTNGNNVGNENPNTAPIATALTGTNPEDFGGKNEI